MKYVTLAHGNGGIENNTLIKDVFYKYFQNHILNKNEDSAILDIHSSKVAFCTDSFTITPLFFNGGNIGKLSICGTCNDLAMMGAKPKYISCSFVIEEGFEIDKLKQITKSMADELQINDALIVTGDTKVMPKGTIDKLIINTSGIGELLTDSISSNNISSDDVIIISRDIGSHGAMLFAIREGIDFDSSLLTDSTSLFPVVKSLLDSNVRISALRDATRGGVSAVLNEWSSQSSVSIDVSENSIPISDEVFGFCEILGLDAMSLANEGTFLLAVKKDDRIKALDILKKFNSNASIIASVVDDGKNIVTLTSEYNTKRLLEYPSGEILPRIC
jgi:hydrogenase expression/formation protein HypE